MKNFAMIAAGIVLAGMMTAGCSKKIQLTVYNHSQLPQTVQVTVPDGTMTLGQVSPDGMMSRVVAIKNEDLPAQMNVNAVSGGSISCQVDKYTPKQWFFHINADGGVTGPYGKDDQHAADPEVETIRAVIPNGMIVR